MPDPFDRQLVGRLRHPGLTHDRLVKRIAACVTADVTAR